MLENTQQLPLRRQSLTDQVLENLVGLEGAARESMIDAMLAELKDQLAELEVAEAADSTILLKSLQSKVSNRNLPIADIADFLPTRQILELYEAAVSEARIEFTRKVTQAHTDFSNAKSKADRGSAINNLGKYNEIQVLIRSGVTLEELLASTQFQKLLGVFYTEAARFLDAQIAKTNELINSREVQTKVAEDFNSYNYMAFDVNNGDNNCQSRIFLMDLFRQDVSYAELTPAEKLTLTLCHITSQLKNEIRDVFGLLLKDEDNGRVAYGSRKLSALKANPNIEIQLEKLYLISDLLGQAVSQISVDYMLAVADDLGDAALKQDLQPYARQMQHHSKTKPQQQLQAAGVEAMYRCIERNQLPFAYRITRLTSTTLASGEAGFRFQGAALVDSVGNLIEVSTDEPIIVFELYAVDTLQARTRAANTELARIAGADSFDSFLSELRNYGLQRLIVSSDILLDTVLQGEVVVYFSPTLVDNVPRSNSLKNCLSSTYVSGRERSQEGVILAPCHIFVSTTQSEVAKITALRERCPEAGIRI